MTRTPFLFTAMAWPQFVKEKNILQKTTRIHALNAIRLSVTSHKPKIHKNSQRSRAKANRAKVMSQKLTLC